MRGVVPAGQNPHKMWRIDAQSGAMIPLLQMEGLAEPYNAPRQALPPVYWQTGHIDAIRPQCYPREKFDERRCNPPLMIEPRYTVDIDNPSDWARSEWLVRHGELNLVLPASRKRAIPKETALVVFDFDGVMTDNRVWVDQNGQEMAAANRRVMVWVSHVCTARVSACWCCQPRKNPVVAARCDKIKVPVIQGLEDKSTVLRNYLNEHGIDPAAGRFIWGMTSMI